MTDTETTLATVRARLAATEAAAQVDHARELRSLRRDVAYLEDRVAEERLDADPLNAAILEAIKAGDIDTSVFADAAEQLAGIGELRRVLATHGYDILRRT